MWSVGITHLLMQSIKPPKYGKKNNTPPPGSTEQKSRMHHFPKFKNPLTARSGSWEGTVKYPENLGRFAEATTFRRKNQENSDTLTTLKSKGETWENLIFFRFSHGAKRQRKTLPEKMMIFGEPGKSKYDPPQKIRPPGYFQHQPKNKTWVTLGGWAVDGSVIVMACRAHRNQ